jgi:hypothetical protein
MPLQGARRSPHGRRYGEFGGLAPCHRGRLQFAAPTPPSELVRRPAPGFKRLTGAPPQGGVWEAGLKEVEVEVNTTNESIDESERTAASCTFV